MLWTDTVAEIGRQSYHNQQSKNSTSQFMRSTKLDTSLKDRGNDVSLFRIK